MMAGTRLSTQDQGANYSQPPAPVKNSFIQVECCSLDMPSNDSMHLFCALLVQ